MASLPNLSSLTDALSPPEAAPTGVNADGSLDAQERLKRDGVVVIKTALADPDVRAATRAAFYDHIRGSPEFLNPTPQDPQWKPSLGGFAGMANPSSFHHKFVRQLREMIVAEVLEADVLPLEGRSLEKVFDRFIFRNQGDTPSAESMHRDEAETAVDGDTIFGGWVNLDDHDHFFSCAPRTHTMVGGQNKGFAKIKSASEQAYFRAMFQRIVIPPGHMILFYERLVHEVLSIMAPRRMLRLMLGWRITDQTEPLFGEALTTEWTQRQGVPYLKSGQHTPILPALYLSNWWRRIEPWATRMFQAVCLTTHTIGSGVNAGTTYMLPRMDTLRDRSMLSLQEYGLPLHPPYDDDELRLLRPQREWMLYTFASPGARVRYVAPSAEDWALYETTRRMVSPGQHVRRPRPSQSVPVARQDSEWSVDDELPLAQRPSRSPARQDEDRGGPSVSRERSWYGRDGGDEEWFEDDYDDYAPGGWHYDRL